MSREPLAVGDPRYVPLHPPGLCDPVELLAFHIEASRRGTVQFVSGSPGNGKSTELNRLAGILAQRGFHTLSIDLAGHLDMWAPVTCADFLIALGSGVGHALQSSECPASTESFPSFWDHLAALLVRLAPSTPTLGPAPSAADLGLNFKASRHLRSQLALRLAGHHAALQTLVHDFIASGMAATRERSEHALQPVLLVDSLDHIRGVRAEAAAVCWSVESLFASHCDALQLPELHVVYTVPHYLRVAHPDLASRYRNARYQLIPTPEIANERGDPKPAVIAQLRCVVEARADWRPLLPNAETLTELILLTGGNLQALFSLLKHVLGYAQTLPVSEVALHLAKEAYKSTFQPLAIEDAHHLVAIPRIGLSHLISTAHFPDAAHFLNTGLIQAHGDNETWYAIHPGVRGTLGGLGAHPAVRRPLV
ncbi:MAG: hypothetical protein R3F39_12465 [Myxococcota bacterium]